MLRVYFEVRFRVESEPVEWPSSFAIVTAHATTGESWTVSENRAADRQLQHRLTELGVWFIRLTGYSPVTGHAEPGWAAELSFVSACCLGHAFRQDAIYFVENDNLFVSYCDQRRDLVSVGDFRSRLDPSQ